MLADGISTVNSDLLRRYASVLLVLIIINDYPIFVEIAIFSHKQSGIAVYLDGDPVFYGRSVSRSRVRALLR